MSFAGFNSSKFVKGRLQAALYFMRKKNRLARETPIEPMVATIANSAAGNIIADGSLQFVPEWFEVAPFTIQWGDSSPDTIYIPSGSIFVKDDSTPNAPADGSSGDGILMQGGNEISLQWSIEET